MQIKMTRVSSRAERFTALVIARQSWGKRNEGSAVVFRIAHVPLKSILPGAPGPSHLGTGELLFKLSPELTNSH
jgi:hypothetical protein